MFTKPPISRLQDNPQESQEKKCPQGYKSLYCYRCGDRLIIPIRCNKRTCVKCAFKRMKKVINQVWEVIQHWVWVCHIVLTIERVESVDEGVKILKEGFSRLKRQVGWKRRINSAIGAIELKKKEDGWHVHLHLIALCRWIPQAELAEMWKRATKGKGYIVFVKRAGHKWGLVQEVLKYVFKVSLYRDERVKEEIEEKLKNKKLIVFDRFPRGISSLDYTEMFEHVRCRCGGEYVWVPGLSRVITVEEYEKMQELDRGGGGISLLSPSSPGNIF